MEIEFLEKINLVSDIWEIYFARPAAFAYDAGDYVDLSVPNVDAHMLSMSSNPKEENLRFTVRITNNPSKFKRALAKLKSGDKCYISPAIGNFNLPYTDNKKILFVALGIGITPFRSLLQEDDLPADTQVLYAANSAEHIYEDVIKQSGAEYVKQDQKLNGKLILQLIPDCAERIVYLSGPEAACIQIYSELLGAGIKRHNIKLEYFPGYS